MTEAGLHNGVMAAVLERLEKYRLPRALALKAKVDRGGTLDQADLDFLEQVLSDARQLKRLVDHRPDVQPLFTRGISLYSEITAKALDNERNS